MPLSTLLRPPELAAQLQVAGVTHLVLARDVPRPRLPRRPRGGRARRRRADRAPGAGTPRLPSLRARVARRRPARATRSTTRSSTRSKRAVRPADDFVVLFTSGSRGAPKGTIHTHGSALRRGRVRASTHAASAPDDRLYIPMPFFWTGGLAGGLLTALVAGATLLTEAVPEPERTLALLERERATLFRGWPDQAARLAAHPRFATTDLSSLGPGQPARRAPAGRSARRPARGRTSSG